MIDVDAEIARVLYIEVRYGLDEELTEYLKWLYHQKEGGNKVNEIYD